jgi:hypothetical protein
MSHPRLKRVSADRIRSATALDDLAQQPDRHPAARACRSILAGQSGEEILTLEGDCLLLQENAFK